MGKMFCLGVSVLWVCAAQSNPPTPAETEKIQAGLVGDLRGQTENAEGKPPELPKGGPPTGSVSVGQLRHKLGKSSQKHLSRGVAFSQSGNSAHAAAEFEKAIAEDPEYAEAHTRLGVEYTALNRHAESEAAFRRAMALDPGNWDAYYDLGVLLYKIGDFDGAEQSARRALDLSKGDARVHFLLGQLLLRHAETIAESLQHLQFAARSIPEAEQVFQGLRVCCDSGAH